MWLTKANMFCDVDAPNNVINVYNQSGMCFSVPKEWDLSAEQLDHLIFDLANAIFYKGFNSGKNAKLYEIKTALGLM